MSYLELMPVTDSVQRAMKNQDNNCLEVSKPPEKITNDLDKCNYISGDTLAPLTLVLYWAMFT